MILLSFTVRNHASIRDEVNLDLARPQFRTLQPVDGDWIGGVYPLAGIFGGNATGKSALLDALIFMFSAIQQSSTAWQASKTMQRVPFKLDGTAESSSSNYELDFVHDGRRFRYGFEVDSRGIKSEWLRDVPSLRWRTLLDRDRDQDRLTFHPSLKTKIEVTERELVLSRALLLSANSMLRTIAAALMAGFDFVLVKDSHRAQRLSSIADSLADETISFSDLEALLRVADIGVETVSVDERNIPDHVRTALRRYLDNVNAELGPVGGRVSVEEDDLAEVVRHLLFTHRGSLGQSPVFSINEESDGTIAWLAIAVPALETLRSGGLIIVDEIDASLHPHLLELLLGAFADPETNSKGAQLIFTSHESYVLSPLSEVQLEAGQVWFTDKSYEGATELTCLADFPQHPDANVAKRYLTGRYGGTPRLSPSTFAALVEAGA